MCVYMRYQTLLQLRRRSFRPCDANIDFSEPWVDRRTMFLRCGFELRSSLFEEAIDPFFDNTVLRDTSVDFSRHEKHSPVYWLFHD